VLSPGLAGATPVRQGGDSPLDSVADGSRSLLVLTVTVSFWLIEIAQMRGERWSCQWFGLVWITGVPTTRAISRV
jgi:hypothetical protein